MSKDGFATRQQSRWSLASGWKPRPDCRTATYCKNDLVRSAFTHLPIAAFSRADTLNITIISKFLDVAINI